MIAPIQLNTYACGHREIGVVGVFHDLCPACDARVAEKTGISSEKERFFVWKNRSYLHRANCLCAECKEERGSAKRAGPALGQSGVGSG